MHGPPFEARCTNVHRAPQGDGEQNKHHRSFSVDRPASASTIEMIQKRITICGSVQPFCSK